jgi:hypothetical protein
MSVKHITNSKHQKPETNFLDISFMDSGTIVILNTLLEYVK